MNRIYYFIIACMLTITSQTDAAIERRAALDIGSGGTKVAIADVETDTNAIVEMLYEHSFPVAYQASLDRSPNGTFDSETRENGLKTFVQIKEITEQLQVQKIAAIATSAFRKANNAAAFVDEIRQLTNISVRIIPQREEGEIAFHSALATGAYESDELVVCDIGTGSLQMSVANPDHSLSVYMGENMGSISFKSYIIDVIQEKDSESSDVLSPNPISEDDLYHADSYARAFARKAFPAIKTKIKANKGQIVGIGRLFYHSIRPLAAENGVITRSGLRNYIYYALEKTDEELDNPFAHVDVSNCILALAMMKGLQIESITPIETTSIKGILVFPSFW